MAGVRLLDAVGINRWGRETQKRTMVMRLPKTVRMNAKFAMV